MPGTNLYCISTRLDLGRSHVCLSRTVKNLHGQLFAQTFSLAGPIGLGGFLCSGRALEGMGFHRPRGGAGGREEGE